MNSELKYKKIGETVITPKNIPNTSKEAEAWQGQSHSFSLLTEDIKEDCFKLFVSCLMQSIPPVGVSAIAMKALATNYPDVQIKIGDTYIEFNTLDTYNIRETEKENSELIYEIIIISIRNFNSLFQINGRNFALGRLYKEPTYEECLLQITDCLGNVK